jgi:transposase
LVKAKLDLSVRVFECDTCALVLDRDSNAAINIAREGTRLLEQEGSDARDTQHVAGLRPETLNADPGRQKTTGAHARWQPSPEGRTTRNYPYRAVEGSS